MLIQIMHSLDHYYCMRIFETYYTDRVYIYLFPVGIGSLNNPISNLLATNHKLNQIKQSKDINEQNYPSIQHYRNACNQRLSFKSCLRKLNKVFQAEAKKFVSGTSTTATTPSPYNQSRTIPN